MTDVLLIACLALLLVCVLLLLIIMTRRSTKPNVQAEQILHEGLRRGREESANTSAQLREEVSRNQKTTTDTIVNTMGAMARSQKEGLFEVSTRIEGLTTSNEARLENLRTTVDTQLKQLQENNEKKLEEMRMTVDEKLHNTLEKRLGESFKQVSDHLEAVQRGLGEMQSLATGVGDLKQVLTNVKVRGTWGEVQLQAILELILTPDQYAGNVQTKKGSSERVEYAVKLPGHDDHHEGPVWLPIDAKFPQEDYLRLVTASENADIEAVKKAREALIRSIESSAKDINSKYVNPPDTTDFAIMFLPTEGLYSEVLREAGLLEKLQHNYRIVIAGPTTLSAILNSLRMGFRTLAIEKRSSEVWQVLAAVKTEFGKFGDVLDKVKRQLDTVGKTIEATETRTRAMQRKLKDVEQLPDETVSEFMTLAETESIQVEDEELPV
ncbi:MAG: DNA recombination protein RmuC [Thermoleophilia bacterium]|jgi:DNA recombination protein RmuC